MSCTPSSVWDLNGVCGGCMEGGGKGLPVGWQAKNNPFKGHKLIQKESNLTSIGYQQLTSLTKVSV